MVFGKVGKGVDGLPIIPMGAQMATEFPGLVLFLPFLVTITSTLQDISLPLTVLFALFTGDASRHS